MAPGLDDLAIPKRKRSAENSCCTDELSSDNNPVSFHRRNLPHIQRDYRPHFITFCTKECRVLPDWAKSIVLDCCTHGHDTIYNLYIAVVMPDHVHMILTPMEDRDRMMISSLSEIMKGIKGTAAHAINRRLKRRGPVWWCGRTRVWTRRLLTFWRIPCVRGWLMFRVSIRGCG